ncbi:MAG: hypothetical protein QNJ54_18480 [Prochloraceae cyanobacterium]|nr:hypothetical protein [Prochloraceae cyanobacterium]
MIIEKKSKDLVSQQAKYLTAAKKDSDFLKSANAQVLQQTLRTLDRA